MNATAAKNQHTMAAYQQKTHLFSKKFWGKCAAVCATLALSQAHQADAASLSFDEHNRAIAPGQLFDMPAIRGGTTSLTYSILDSNGQIITSGYFGSGTTVPLTHGTLKLQDQWVYTPVSGYTGEDYFTYSVSDSNGQMVAETFSVNAQFDVQPLTLSEYNHTEIIQREQLSSPINFRLPTKIGGVLPYKKQAWLKPNGNNMPISTTLTTYPFTLSLSKGTLSSIDGQNYTYQANQGFIGAEYFTYMVVDAKGQLAMDTFKISTPPLVVPTYTDQIMVTTRSSASIPTPEISDGFMPYVFSVLSQTTVSGGTVVINNNVFNYTPPANFIGMDSFTYKVTDATNTSAQNTYTLTVGLPTDLNGTSYTLSDPTLSVLNALNNTSQTTSLLTINLNNTSQTLSAAITGNIGITKNGSQTLIVTSANSSTGPTTVNQGTLSIVGDANLGTGPLTLNGGALGFINPNPASISLVTLVHDIILTANSVIDTSGVALTLTGNISGNGFGLSFIGNGSITFVPAQGKAHTYTGATQISTITRLIGSVPLSSSSYPVIFVDGDQIYTRDNQITGPSALVKDGFGEMYMKNLTGSANNYASGTYIRKGKLTVENNAQIPYINLSKDVVTFAAVDSSRNPILVASTSNAPNIPVLNANVGLTELKNDIAFLSIGTIGNSDPLNLSGRFSGPGDFNKTGTGVTTISGTSNTQTGNLHIKNGEVAISDARNLGNTPTVYIENGVLHIKKTMTSTSKLCLGGVA